MAARSRVRLRSPNRRGYILETTGQNYSIVFTIAGTLYLLALGIIHLLTPQLTPVGDVERGSSRTFSAGTFIGFGFMGLVFGSFVCWCVSLLMKVPGGVQFEYMMIAGGIGAAIGVLAGLVLNRPKAEAAA